MKLILQTISSLSAFLLGAFFVADWFFDSTLFGFENGGLVFGAIWIVTSIVYVVFFDNEESDNEESEDYSPHPDTYEQEKNDKSQSQLDSNDKKWDGNGTGIFVSINGHIATNYHVIEDVKYIGVEFRYKGQMVTFDAKVQKIDKHNDLAIIKINDPNFLGLLEIPYNLQTKTINLGAKVYALGYPHALNLMGKDMKFTDGKISAKTGAGGDVRVYQTTAPLQAGNSGGPLFDFKGNLVGINSAKLVFDGIEGVSYAIKSSYLSNLIEVLGDKINTPSNKNLSELSLEDQINILNDFVVLIKVKN